MHEVETKYFQDIKSSLLEKGLASVGEVLVIRGTHLCGVFSNFEYAHELAAKLSGPRCGTQDEVLVKRIEA